MERLFVEDIRKALSNKEDFWLNLSILLYVAVLPFNAFALHILPGPYFRLNVTKAALFLVVVFGLRSYFQGRLEIKKAYLLYSFLIFQVLANFLSILNSPHSHESLLLAITVSQYSILVFILINVFRSESLLKATLRVMGIVVLIIIIHSIGIYLWNGGVFFTREQPSLLGNRIGHYLAYCLLMFGTGLVYSLFTKESKWVNYLLWIFTGLWIWVIYINPMKASHIVLFSFLSLLLVTLQKERKKVLSLIALAIFLLIIQFNVVPITNTYLALQSIFATRDEPVYLEVFSPKNALYYRWVVGGNSLEVRVRGWLSGLMIGMSHPLTGVGVGQTTYYVDDYSELVRQKTQNMLPSLPFRNYFISDTAFPPGIISVYNIFLNAWAETGIFGLIGIVGIIFLIIIKGFPVFLAAGRSESMNAFHFLFPLFLSILLYHQVVYLWVHPWFWTIIALAYAATDISDTRSRSKVQY